MGLLNKGEKPTRAERKAQKKVEQAAIKEVEFDARELAKEEKRAARAAGSWWGRKKREASGDDDESRQSDDFDLTAPLPAFDHGSNTSRDFAESPAEGVGVFSPVDTAPDNGSDEFLLEDRATELHNPGRRASDRQFASPERLDVQPGNTGISPPPEVGSLAPVSQRSAQSSDDLEEEPKQRRGFGLRRAKKKAEPEVPLDPVVSPAALPAVSPGPEKGTQIRPVSPAHATAAIAPLHAVRAEAVDPAVQQQPLSAQGAAQESFAILRRAVSEPDDVLLLDDPVVEPVHLSSVSPTSAAAHQTGKVEPLRLDREATPIEMDGFSDNWIGLWISEDGAAIFIEEDDDGWYAVTVMPDPKSMCYAGPEYPEIQSYRMPASYEREELGEFDGERLSVITVPGLPEGYRSPMMHIYFLTSIPAAQGGGNRFATPEDPTRRVFIAADLELGTVNPWSDQDDIAWIDPSVNYYKAPGKLDAYMIRRMSTDDPLN